MANRRRARAYAGVVAAAASCVWLMTGPASADEAEALYSGYEGEDFVFNGAAYSGTLKGGMEDTVLRSFAEKTGVNVLFDTFCCGIAKLQAAQDSGNVPWTIVSFSTMTDLLLAEREDLLLEIDPEIVPLDQLEPGGYDKNAIYGYPYAAVIAWNTEKWPLDGKHPEAIEDIFDTEAFPGKRCLYKYPQFGGTMEAALLSAGVPVDALYPLDTTKAFEALNAIRDDIVWWNTGSQGVQQLVSGACDIALLWNGPISEAIRANGGPFAIAFGHAVWDYTPISIPKGVKNEKAAQAFLRWMIEDREAQKAFVEQTAYVMLPLKEQVPISDEVAPWVLAGSNLDTAIRENDAYYVDNIGPLLEKFNGWVTTGDIPQ